MTLVAKTRKIDDKKLQERVGFHPHVGQQQVLDVDSRMKVLCCGTRWGKSNLAAYIAVRELMKTNKRIWVVAPTYDLGNKIFTYIEKFIVTGFPTLHPGIVKRPFPRIETPWGSWIEVKSGENPAGLLGEELDLVIIDEASRIKKDIWTNYIFARLAMRQGEAVIISTPFGKNWFYEEWVKADALGSAFHFETRDNPYLPPGEWERAQEKLPEHSFKQEYMATFMEDASSVFRGIREVIDDTLRDVEPDGRYVVGVDIAMVNDYTVITVMNQMTNSVVHWERFNQIDWTLQKARIVAVAQRYNDARVVLDSTGLGNPISEDLQKAGVMVDDFKFNNTSKDNLITKLVIFIEQKLIRIPDIDELINELDSYAMMLSDGGNRKFSAPSGLHDDCVISLALAVWNLDRDMQKPNPLFVSKVVQNRSSRRSFR